MNVTLDPELSRDAMTIETGVHKLQSQIAHVIDRTEPTDAATSQEIRQRNRQDLQNIIADLKDFIQRQKEFCKLVSKTQKEVTDMNDEIHALRCQTENLYKLE